MPTAKSISFKKLDGLNKTNIFGVGFHYYFTVYLNTYVSQFSWKLEVFWTIFFDDGEKFRLKSISAKSSRSVKKLAYRNQF